MKRPAISTISTNWVTEPGKGKVVDSERYGRSTSRESAIGRERRTGAVIGQLAAVR
jgi:hypothetical protein